MLEIPQRNLVLQIICRTPQVSVCIDQDQLSIQSIIAFVLISNNKKYIENYVIKKL